MSIRSFRTSPGVILTFEKEERNEKNQPPRFRCAGTAQRGAPIFYRARAECIFSRHAVSVRVSTRH